jgi:hypothetical protein
MRTLSYAKVKAVSKGSWEIVNRIKTLYAQGKAYKKELHLVEQEIDHQATRFWGLTDSDLVQVSSFR